MMNRALPLLLFLSVFAASRMQAQGISTLPAGVRVRITVADSARQSPLLPRAQSVIGNVARATADTLWLRIAGPDTVRVPRSTLRRVEVSRGVSRTRSAVEHGRVLGAFTMPRLRRSVSISPGSSEPTGG